MTYRGQEKGQQHDRLESHAREEAVNIKKWNKLTEKVRNSFYILQMSGHKVTWLSDEF